MTDEELESAIAILNEMMAAQAVGSAHLIEMKAQPAALPAPGGSPRKAVQAPADDRSIPIAASASRSRLMMRGLTRAIRPAGAQAAQGAIACKHLTSQCLAATRGGSGLQTGKTSSHAGLCGTQRR